MSFARKLVAWQRRQGRHDLPWQGTRDPYRIWLSEVMLQQTQVAAVIPYYERFLRKYPTVEALSRADQGAKGRGRGQGRRRIRPDLSAAWMARRRLGCPGNRRQRSIGLEGRQLYRVRYSLGPEFTAETELPAEALEVVRDGSQAG